MDFLLNNRLDPITKEIGFFECDLKSVVAAYGLWMTEVLRPYGMRIELENIEGNLETVLRNLLPLTIPIPCRFAFVPTQSAWTAYFDNSIHGTDSAGPVHVLAKKLNCRSVRAVLVPNTMPSRPARESKGRFGATMLELYGPDGKEIRVIYAANDGGKWRFGEHGSPFAFEEVEKYRAKRIRDRFTGEMLSNYLRNLGITAAFDETFYAPQSAPPSILVKKKGELSLKLKEVSLK